MRNLIFLWSCEGIRSRNYYDEKQKAINAVIKRFKVPDSFEVSEYVNTGNESLLKYIKEKVEYSKTVKCKSGASGGVKRDIDVIIFVQDIRLVVND